MSHSFDEQTNTLKRQHEEMKHCFTALRSDMFSISALLKKLVEKGNSRSGDAAKRQKLNTDRNHQSSIIAFYRFLKTRTAFEMLDKDKDTQIFHINQHGSNYSTQLQNALCDVLGLQTVESQVSFLNRHVHIMKTKQSVVQFLDRTSGRIYDAILSKFLTAFF